MSNLLNKALCHFNQHSWRPYGIQWWISPVLGMAGYKNAECKYCYTLANKPTNFYLKDVPSDQIFGSSSPFQITEEDVVWYYMDYGPPPGLGLKNE